ncbi:unnamed protein product [Chrysoparadoxa australica]
MSSVQYVEETLDLSGPQTAGEPRGLEEFDLHPRLCDNLRRAGITNLFPVQEMTYQTIQGGRDLMVKSRTGSGKTLAFAIPIVQRLSETQGRGGRRHGGGRNPRAVIVAPTRELAKQVMREFERIAPGLSHLSVYGGTPMGPQCNALRRGVDVVVGTPGRMIDLAGQGVLKLNDIQFCVLDEADMMLQMGFQDDVEQIFSYLPESRQTMLWSATMPGWVNRLSRKYLDDPKFVDLVLDDDVKIPSTINHIAITAHGPLREDALYRVLSVYGRQKQSIVFTQTKAEVDKLTGALSKLGVMPLHGGLSQSQRESTLQQFRDGRVNTIVCTDIAARGLDTSVDLVVHYRLPSEMESFVHRSGRTGRAGKSGTNIIMLDTSSEASLHALQREYSFSAHRAVAPGGDVLHEERATEVRNDTLRISPRVGQRYQPIAAEIMRKMGGDVGELSKAGLRALTAALAVAGGVTVDGGDGYSIIDGRPGMASVLLTSAGLRSQRDLQGVLREVAPELARDVTHVRLAKGGMVVDLTTAKAEQLVEAVERVGAKGPRLCRDLVASIPREIEGGFTDNHRGRISYGSSQRGGGGGFRKGGNRGGGGGYGGGNGRGGGGQRRGGRNRGGGYGGGGHGSREGGYRHVLGGGDIFASGSGRNNQRRFVMIIIPLLATLLSHPHALASALSSHLILSLSCSLSSLLACFSTHMLDTLSSPPPAPSLNTRRGHHLAQSLTFKLHATQGPVVTRGAEPARAKSPHEDVCFNKVEHGQ